MQYTNSYPSQPIMPPVFYYMRTYQEEMQVPGMLLSDSKIMIQADFRCTPVRFSLCFDMGTGDFIDADEPNPILRPYHIEAAIGVQAFFEMALRNGINLWGTWKLVPQRQDALVIIQQAYGANAVWFSPALGYRYLIGRTQQGQAICLAWEEWGIITQDVVRAAYQEVCYAQMLIPFALFGRNLQYTDPSFIYHHIQADAGSGKLSLR